METKAIISEIEKLSVKERLQIIEKTDLVQNTALLLTNYLKDKGFVNMVSAICLTIVVSETQQNRARETSRPSAKL